MPHAVCALGAVAHAHTCADISTCMQTRERLLGAVSVEVAQAQSSLGILYAPCEMILYSFAPFFGRFWVSTAPTPGKSTHEY